MDKETRIKSFAKLGGILKEFVFQSNELSPEINNKLEETVKNASAHNAWFTSENMRFALQQWSSQLSEDNLENWLQRYDLTEKAEKKVAVIMAGNIPLVGFHDFLSVLISGHSVLVKQSSKDKILLPALTEILKQINPKWEDKIEFEDERLSHFDAIIATGSNNTARYFDYYFSDKPNIIRKNRNAVAVLSGEESTEVLKPLAEDVFRYFGLGCRSVSKIFVPKNYDFDKLFQALYGWKHLINHHKYASNYDYNKAVYLMSEFKMLENGFLLLKETPGEFASPIAVLFYEFYDDKEQLKQYLKDQSENIQCVLSHKGEIEGSLPYGESQNPKLTDYADGVDTMDFLTKLLR
jgi:hypothetical protein